LGKEEWLDDPRFADPVSRNVNRDVITKEIEAWLDTIGDAQEAVRILVEENHVPAAPVLDVPEVMTHPHMVQRGIVQTVTDRIFGEVKIPASPLKFSQFPEPLELQASFLGEHNVEILTERLGYTREDVAKLQSAGVLTSKDI
jgi:crotonobetainyl-CoA:carnitine CoA-transferase CaiB-like acyl-CoA transferase